MNAKNLIIWEEGSQKKCIILNEKNSKIEMVQCFWDEEELMWKTEKEIAKMDKIKDIGLSKNPFN